MKSIYLGDHRALLETVDHCMMFVDTRDMIVAPNLLMRNAWEVHETELVKRLLKPGMTFVDIGANIGYFTLLAGRVMGPGSKVFAFEPEPRSFELLRRNVVVNAMLDFIVTVPKAVYRRTEKLRFHVRKDYRANSGIAKSPQAWLDYLYDETEEIEVDAVTLDEYFSSDVMIDVMKIDVEGAEPGAFAGMHNTLKRSPSISILCEWSPSQIRDAGNNAEELLAEFEAQEFVPYEIGGNLKRLSLKDLPGIPYCNLLLRRE